MCTSALAKTVCVSITCQVCIAPAVLVQTTRFASSVKKLPITHGVRPFHALAENEVFSSRCFHAAVYIVCTDSITKT